MAGLYKVIPFYDKNQVVLFDIFIFYFHFIRLLAKMCAIRNVSIKLLWENSIWFLSKGNQCRNLINAGLSTFLYLDFLRKRSMKYDLLPNLVA